MTKKCFAIVSEYRIESKNCNACEHFAECGEEVTNKIAMIHNTLPADILRFMKEHEEVVFQSDLALYRSPIGSKIVKCLNALSKETHESLVTRKNLVGASNKPLSAVIDLLLNNPTVTNDMVRAAVGEKSAASILLMWMTRKNFIRLNGFVQELIV